MDLDQLRMFVAVAEGGSFSAAARRLGVTPAAVSLGIKRLEAVHGVRLVERSTRALRLTPAGTRFAAGAERMLAEWAETSAALRGEADAVAGEVHVSAPADFTYQYLEPWLAELQSRHPALEVNLHVSDRVQDLKREPLDVAIRYGELGDSALVARRLLATHRVAVASPRRVPKPARLRRPEDLLAHPALLWRRGEQPVRDWAFWPGRHLRGAATVVRVRGALVGDSWLVRKWAVEGRGIASKALCDVIGDLEARRLVAVPAGFRGEDAPVHAVLNGRQGQSRRVQVVVEHLVLRSRELQARLDAWAARQASVED